MKKANLWKGLGKLYGLNKIKASNTEEKYLMMSFKARVNYSL